ncbi:baseplate wedge protein [Synechococcus phage MA10]
MATPKFFQQIRNNVEYAMKASHVGVTDFIEITDFFRSMVIRRDVFDSNTLYYTYNVKDGERPDQISYEEYGDEQYYWVILQTNGITDYYSQWPLSNQELEEYANKKYGGVEGANATHHYETVETYNSDGVKVLDGGLVVPQDFVFYYYDTETVELSSLPVEVTNLQYEKKLNEDKAEILILDKKYLYDYKREWKLYLDRTPGAKSEVDISEIF